MSQTRDQQRFTISEVAADWHEPMVLQCIMWSFIAVLMDNWTHVAASRTIAPISHARPSPRSRSYYSFPIPLKCTYRYFTIRHIRNCIIGTQSKTRKSESSWEISSKGILWPILVSRDLHLWPLTSWPPKWSFHAFLCWPLVPIFIKIGLLPPTKEEVNAFVRICLSVCLLAR